MRSFAKSAGDTLTTEDGDSVRVRGTDSCGTSFCVGSADGYTYIYGTSYLDGNSIAQHDLQPPTHRDGPSSIYADGDLDALSGRNTVPDGQPNRHRRDSHAGSTDEHSVLECNFFRWSYGQSNFGHGAARCVSSGARVACAGQRSVDAEAERSGAAPMEL